MDRGKFKYLWDIADDLAGKREITVVMKHKLPMGPLVIPSDQSALISRIAVPSQDCNSDDELIVYIGEMMVYSAPVGYLLHSSWDTGGANVDIVIPPRSEFWLETRVRREPHHHLYAPGKEQGQPLVVYAVTHMLREEFCAQA